MAPFFAKRVSEWWILTSTFNITFVISNFSLAKLSARLQTEESLATQAQLLVEALCPTYEDPALCEAVLTLHWALVGLAIYPQFLVPEAICTGLGSCFNKRNDVREWTCEECTNGIGGIVDILAGAIPDVIEFLKVRSSGICTRKMLYCSLFVFKIWHFEQFFHGQ